MYTGFCFVFFNSGNQVGCLKIKVSLLKAINAEDWSKLFFPSDFSLSYLSFPFLPDSLSCPCVSFSRSLILKSISAPRRCAVLN